MAAAASPSWGSCLAAHLLIFSWYVFTITKNCSLNTERHPGVHTYGGRWKYLTFLDLVRRGRELVPVSIFNIKEYGGACMAI